MTKPIFAEKKKLLWKKERTIQNFIKLVSKSIQNKIINTSTKHDPAGAGVLITVTVVL